MISGWNEFTFFETTPVIDPSSKEAPLYSDPELLDISPGENGTVFMTTREGLVKEFSVDMEKVSEFAVCDADSGKVPELVRSIPNTRLLLTVASKIGHPLEVSVWDLSTHDVHARATVVNGSNTHPVTAFCMSADASVLVFGFGDGSVIAVRGDLLHDRGTRQRVLYKDNASITGLALTDSGDQVFVSSLERVIVVSSTASKSLKFLDKAKGAELGCTAKARDEFLVARNEGLAWFSTKHRGPSVELPFTKRRVMLTKDEKYLVVVALVGPNNRSILSTESVRLIIVDLRNNIVAFNSHLSSGIRAVFEQWDRLNIIGSNGVMYVLKEKSLESRLSTLKSRNLYQVAIKMAGEAETDRVKLLLHQDFADYLFEKNDIDACLKEYIAAIDLGQSSRAIRRFKDSHHAATLLKYLVALYNRGLSTTRHVTLQIICYTKLDKLDELVEFLRSAVEIPDFDFERAISILTEMHDSRYAALAAYVAEKWPDPDLVVQIRLRQLDDVQSTLDYIQTVSRADALRILIQNSRLLLNKLPVETTGVLITLFTGRFVTKSPKTDELGSLGKKSSPQAATDTPVLQSYQAFINFLSSASYLGSHIVSAETLEANVDEPSYSPPRPRLIFPSFIGHDNEFVIFLEACLHAAARFDSSEKDMNDIATTLFETYLKVGAQDRASELVDKYASILYRVNIETVSEVFQFKLTPEQQLALGSSHTDVLRNCIETGDIDAGLNLYYEYSTQDSGMLTQAIRLFSSNKPALDHIRSKSGDELSRICEKALASDLTPVQLIAVLNKSPFVTIGDIKPFMMRYLKSNADQTRRHAKLAESYESEIAEKQAALEKQNESTLMLQYNNCNQCDQPLDLPAVHFACQHSYHLQCIGPDAECPICLPENESIELLRSQKEETAAQQDYFLSELNKRQDKMKVILDFVSRGALSEIH